ncbi:RNA polymerase II degradation factor 1-like [Eutrema salsugineum]|uniref:RNA polymerase II degradation factor 1-like n=1 Tax=Eutrema salsugineum TaxID=72664 RepID=UPI000CED0130|nr:RNA polymerase II degradation factor 1-like [Eutrema salsugineum]
MVQNSKFHGLPMEDPLEHLDQFDRVCDLTKINGVSEDSFKLRFFPFSLGDKAHQWEKNLPRGSIQTWEQCKLAFLSKFFSTSRTAKLRNQISSFKKHNNEIFGEAWERRALPQIRNQLDTASNGNFLAKEITSAMELVVNLAMSNDTYGEDYDRTNRSEGSSSDQRLTIEVKELRSELEKLKLVSQKPIHYVSEFNDSPSFENINEDGLTEEEIKYIGNQQRFQRFNNYGANQNLSYRNPNVANPQDQVYPPQQNQQSYAPKPQFQSSFQPKPQFSQPQQQYGQPQHQNLVSNFSSPQQQLKAPPGFNQQPMVQSQQMGPDMCGLLQQLLQGQQRAVSQYASMQQEIRELKQNQWEAAPRDNQEAERAVKGKAKEVENTPEPEKVFVPPPPYQPKLPFPGRIKKQLVYKARAVFEKTLNETPLTMPLIEAFLMMPKLGKFLKDVILNKTKEIQGMVVLSHECSAIIQRKSVPRKLSDPGSFTLPCALGPLMFVGFFVTWEHLLA